MRGFPRGGLVAVAAVLALAPPAVAQVHASPYVDVWTTPDANPANGTYDWRGNATACTGSSEPECWEGSPRVGATFAWEVHVGPSEQSAGERPRACGEVPFPTGFFLPLSPGPPGFWDPFGVKVCINDGWIYFNGCAPIHIGPKLEGRDSDPLWLP